MFKAAVKAFVGRLKPVAIEERVSVKAVTPITQFDEIVGKQGYKPLGGRYVSEAFGGAVAVISLRGVYPTSGEYYKLTADQPPKIFTVAHVILGDRHFVTGAAATPYEIKSGRGILFPPYVGIEEFVAKIGDKDIETFFDEMPRGMEHYSQFAPKSRQPA